MFISDGWLVNYAGFLRVIEVFGLGEGRALYHSIRGNFLIGVFSGSVYRFNTDLVPQFIGSLNSIFGEVSIDENLSAQICIVDGVNAWIYHYEGPVGTFTVQNLTFGTPIIPNYVCYHNTYFLISSSSISTNSSFWYVYELDAGDPTMISFVAQFSIQTKPDFALAIKRIPGRGNNVIVFGSTVAEVWTQVASSVVYQRVQSFNIDSGVVSVNTIAANDTSVIWLGQNENNAPCIFITDGSSVKPISTDGIDYLMQTILHPEQSTGFLYRQDGHLFYQLTFYNPQDNLTLIYDVGTNQFFDITDENMNYHPARQVVYFNGNTYFCSINDASIYQMGTEFIDYNYEIDSNSAGKIIPRSRQCGTIRVDNTSRFRVKRFSFLIEQGVNQFSDLSEICVGHLITESGDHPIITETGYNILSEVGFCQQVPDRPAVDMAFSKNGNQSFSNFVRRELNPEAIFQNIIHWDRLCSCNEFTIQLRFWGFQRFVCNNGVAYLQVEAGVGGTPQ
jgi:hypothetical protein